MNVGSICSRHIISLDVTATLQAAAQRMREFHVGAVVVTRSQDAVAHVVGLLTDRVFRDPQQVGSSMAIASAVFGAMGIAALVLGARHYRACVANAAG